VTGRVAHRGLLREFRRQRPEANLVKKSPIRPKDSEGARGAFSNPHDPRPLPPVRDFRSELERQNL
jgi:hypothetical protein